MLIQLQQRGYLYGVMICPGPQRVNARPGFSVGAPPVRGMSTWGRWIEITIAGCDIRLISPLSDQPDRVRFVSAIEHYLTMV